MGNFVKTAKKKVICAIMLCFVLSGGAFAQGYPTFDAANLIQAIEKVYQGYQEIQHAIENVQNTYKRIEQAAQQMMAMDWSAFGNLGENFAGMKDNPFEVITGVRNSAQDITKAVNDNMNRVNRLQDELTREGIEYGGMKFSVADLCGAGDPQKDIAGFTKNAWQHSKDQIQEQADIWAGKLTYRQRRAIMRKYGMSPRNYATIRLSEAMLSDVVVSKCVAGSQTACKEAYEKGMGMGEAVRILSREIADGDLYAQYELSTSTLGTMTTQLENLGVKMDEAMGLQAQKIKADEQKVAIQQQEAIEESEDNMAVENSRNTVFNNDDVFD